MSGEFDRQERKQRDIGQFAKRFRGKHHHADHYPDRKRIPIRFFISDKSFHMAEAT